MATGSSEKQISEEREQFLYAQDRIRQKKRLNQHFVLFLVGSVFIIILSQFFFTPEHFLVKNWTWIIILWAFLFVVHAFNVFITNRFMGKKWEHKQLVKLREKQRQRLIQLQQQVDAEAATPTVKSTPNESLE